MAGLVVATPATAVTTYSAFDSFDGSGNPAGPFSFGYTDLITFTPFAPANFSNCAPGLLCLDFPALEPALGAYKNITGAPFTAFGTVDVPADVIFLHPGPTLYSYVAFTAPTTGTYSGAVFAELLSNSTITNVDLALGGGGNVFNTATLTALDPEYSSQGLIQLAAGDTIFVAVGPSGNYQFDSTRVDFTLSYVPEPAAWTLLIGGFGLVGASLRRRRAIAA